MASTTATCATAVAKKALVLCADGTEEMELVITVDVLRRGGIDVTVAGVEGPGTVVCSRNVKIVPDKALADVETEVFDVLVLPGGAKGAKTFAETPKVLELIQKQLASDQFLGAICAAPIALKAANVMRNYQVTSHPSVRSQIEDVFKYSESCVVVDGKLITSRGPGTTFEFALSLVEHLMGRAKRDEIVQPMVLPPQAS